MNRRPDRPGFGRATRALWLGASFQVAPPDRARALDERQPDHPGFGLFLGLLGRTEPAKSDAAEHLIQWAPMLNGRAGSHSGSTPQGIHLNGLRRHEMIDSTPNQFELRFQSLFDSGRGYAFPCDLKGLVDLDQLSDRSRNNYLYARAMVGRELAVPAVRPSGMH
jgi:hypothetical protein